MSKTKLLVTVLLLLFFGWEVVWNWMFCRVYVGPGEMMVVTSKMGKANPDPQNRRVVEEGYQGVQKEAFGEGRYFFNPFTYDREILEQDAFATEKGVQRAQDFSIPPGYLGVVECKSGNPAPNGDFLTEDLDHKGVWRSVLTPGKWRLNPVAYAVTVVPAAKIQAGYVGCVTHLIGKDPQNGKLAKPDERGIQEKVVQPGFYYANPREWKIEQVWVGYNQEELKGVTFPSSDGFPVKLDISVVWGVEPSDVPYVMLQYGQEEQVQDKVIQPQVESICRNEGSGYQAKDFIEGTSREAFQKAFTDALTKECNARHIRVVTGLVRDINVPDTLREPIQQAKVAVEEGLTKVEQQTTQTLFNTLKETEADVLKGVRETEAETEKMIAQTKAEGEKKVAEIRADQTVAVAEIERQIAEIEAQRTRILGEASAKAVQLKNEAEANRLKQNVEAIGGGRAYADYIFAMGLPENFQVFIRYAGPGTFWTDMPGGAKLMEDAANMKILEKDGAAAPPRKQK